MKHNKALTVCVHVCVYIRNKYIKRIHFEYKPQYSTDRNVVML